MRSTDKAEPPVVSEFVPVFAPQAAPVLASSPVNSGSEALQSKKDTITDISGGVQSDAPACNVCGHITVRSGTCYKCLNCGNSLGCS